MSDDALDAELRRLAREPVSPHRLARLRRELEAELEAERRTVRGRIRELRRAVAELRRAVAAALPESFRRQRNR